jgi:outer membrane protein TolC
LTGKKLTYSVGPAITLPIFDGGRLRSQLGEAAAGYDIAVAHYNQTLVDALKSISDQLIRRESMDKQHVFAAASVAAAQRTYDIAMVAFQRGLTDYLNVLNAQSLLFKQQQVQQQVEAARLSVHADLVTALGGGLDSVGAVECNEAAIFPQTLESPTKRSKDRSLRQLLRSAYKAQPKREQAPSPRC